MSAIKSPFRAAVLVTGLVLAIAAPAQAGERADYELRFDERRGGVPTGGDLRIVYKAPEDPEGKPPAITYVLIGLPRGTEVGSGVVCEASDAELRALGRDACPAESLIGEGDLTAITGLGPPFDPYPTDLWLFRTPEGMIELVQQPGTNATIAIERGTLSGRRLEFHPPPTPGGPPDFATAVRTIDWRLYGPHEVEAPWLTTPTRCRPAGVWRSRGLFEFGDGGSAVERSTTPCAGRGADCRRGARRRQPLASAGLCRRSSDHSRGSSPTPPRKAIRTAAGRSG